MKGDFSRLTFDEKKHYRRVLMQQGRVQLDSDWNEQADICLHFLQALTKDLIGQHGGTSDAFKIVGELRGRTLRYDFAIHDGHYYVDGLLCENDQTYTYAKQPDYPLVESQLLQKDGGYLVFLDVWERHVTYIDDPEIREVALEGPDTSTRSKTVFQVKVLRLRPDQMNDRKIHPESLLKKAKARTDLPTLTAGAGYQGLELPPGSGYSGLENRLYRVEIHDPSTSPNATFKWSRDNGSAVTPILKIRGAVVTVGPWANHEGLPFSPGDWVEVTDDFYELQGLPGLLRLVGSVDPRRMQVTLKLPLPPGVADRIREHSLMRRWDQKADRRTRTTLRNGAVPVESNRWIALEDGIRAKFSGGDYNTGDYWLIPARVATKGVIWPTSHGKPASLPPRGIFHHYCPLAIVSLDSKGGITRIEDKRRIIEPLGELSATANSLSYYQDQVAANAYLGTARPRVSTRRHGER
jgi:hypothetical protein